MPHEAVAFSVRRDRPSIDLLVRLWRLRGLWTRVWEMCTPTIRISSRYSPPDPPVSSSASPMSIPRAREVAPPPLPPPMYLPEISAGSDPGWQWGNDPNGSDFGRPASIKPGSSLLGSFEKRMQKEHDNMSHYSFNEARRGSSLSTITAGREQDMVDDTAAHNEDDVRPNSNAYVKGPILSVHR